MPLYCFHCKKCDNVFTVLCKHTELAALRPKCENCGSKHTERALHHIGGYGIKGDNSASVRPKSAGYRKDKK